MILTCLLPLQFDSLLQGEPVHPALTVRPLLCKTFLYKNKKKI